MEKIKDELSAQTGQIDGGVGEPEYDPSSFLKKRFIEKLNEYYVNTGVGISVDPADILFTDWIIGDDNSSAVRDFGVSGVEDVKLRIKQYLLKYDIYHESEEQELLQCVSFLT